MRTLIGLVALSWVLGMSQIAAAAGDEAAGVEYYLGPRYAAGIYRHGYYGAFYGSRYVWIPGHWNWLGAEYAWVYGSWAEPPVAGHVWIPPLWVWADGAWKWQQGYWAPPPRRAPV
jgi:hypothetical protein